MQLHRQAITALVILNQAHQRPHGGILDRCAELLGRVAQCAVVTGGICASKQQLGIGTAFLDAFPSGFPNVTSNSPSGVRMVPERAPLETASAVNKVFLTASTASRAGLVKSLQYGPVVNGATEPRRR
jgi:hypothetical protein